MTTSEMTDNELNVAICEALGWTRVPGQWRATLWQEDRTEGDTIHETPDCATSLDALSAVEQRLIAAGLSRMVVTDADGSSASYQRGPEEAWEHVCVSIAPTESRARAEAALLALIAIEPTSITTLASRE